MYQRHGEATDGQWTREYRAWIAARQRCRYRKSIGWKNYGGRGIRMCQRWLDSFPAFLEDMGRCPDPKMTLDRVNNDLGYELGNCRWATRSEQMRNRRQRYDAALLEYDGVRKHLNEWAAEMGISPNALYGRLKHRTLSDILAGFPLVRARSGYIGVHQGRSGKWYAQRMIAGRRFCVYGFATAEEAHEARMKLGTME